jgi:DNA-binding response OmpR family regulator
MQPSSQKANIKILLAEDEIFMREIIVNALSAGGYRDVRSVSTLALLRDILESHYPDLLIVNGELADGDVVNFVRQLRLFRIGRNPFVPIILTSWHSDGPFLRRVADSGADVMVTKPLAAGQLFARIDFLVKTRPPFVSTASYLGPDRRKSNRVDDFPRFDVPNTLQERIAGRVFDAGELGSRISKAFADMKAQRQSMQEKGIGGIFSAISKAAREQAPIEEICGDVEALTSAATQYAHEISASSGERAGLAAALVKTLEEIASREHGFSVQDCDRVSGLIERLGIDIPRDANLPLKAASGVDNLPEAAD